MEDTSTPPGRDALLPAIQGGDKGAFGHWLGAVEERLRLSLVGFSREVDTEVVLQETLLRVWHVAPRVTPDGRPDVLLRFAVRVARNLAVDHVRAVRRHRSEPPDAAAMEAIAVAPAPVPDPALRAVIRDCVGALPKRPAAALQARLGDCGGLPDETLAEQLGMTLNTFLKNFGRARRFLVECLRGRGIAVDPGTGALL